MACAEAGRDVLANCGKVYIELELKEMLGQGALATNNKTLGTISCCRLGPGLTKIELKISQIKHKHELPPGLKNSSRACQYCDDGKTAKMNIEYHPSFVIKVGLHNKLDFRAPAKMRCVIALQQILQASELQLYLSINNTFVFAKTLGLLISKLTLERSRPIMSEYFSKQNNHM